MSKNTKVSILSSFILIILVMVFIESCKQSDEVVSSTSVPVNGNTNQGSKKSVVSGQVINNLTGIPIDSALVQIIGSSVNISLLTDIQGKFSDTIQTSSNTNLVVYVSKTGYILDTTSIFLTAGVDYSISTIRLSVYASHGIIPSGNPVSISLVSQTASNIGVREGGSIETLGLTFELFDSAGVPIDLNHTVTVNFSIGGHPGGGEYISPTSVITNDLGQATVNVTSGTKAGVVQIIAEADLKTGILKSKPVAVTIFGGLPDQNHFSVSTKKMNFPDPTAIDAWANYPAVIELFVGDKYANPVRPNTLVYLTSTGGYAQGSILTDKIGTATADFVVANPYPIDLVYGPGFATITASTADENNNTIYTSKIVYFSGDALLYNISPTTFDVPNGGSQDFTYMVSDKLGYPLAEGTNILVQADGVNVGERGDVNVNIPDTQDKAWTHFGFTIYDTNDSVNVAKACRITIKVLSPNGNPFPQTISGVTR
jgi:hypothetical protein